MGLLVNKYWKLHAAYQRDGFGEMDGFFCVFFNINQYGIDILAAKKKIASGGRHHTKTHTHAKKIDWKVHPNMGENALYSNRTNRINMIMMCYPFTWLAQPLNINQLGSVQSTGVAWQQGIFHLRAMRKRERERDGLRSVLN